MAKLFETVPTGRRQVAREEIETAIKLLFSGGSQIAATILAWAAVDVLRGLAEAAGKETLRQRTEDGIKPEYLTRWRDIERKSYNFFKHADKDPSDELQFRPEALSFVLLYAVGDYGTIYGQNTILMRIYLAWFMSRYPDAFLPGLPGQVETFRELFKFQNEQPFSQSLAAATQFLKDFEEHKEFIITQIPLEQRKTLED